MKKLGWLLVILVPLSMMLASCAAPEPIVVEKETIVEKPVVQTVIVEKTTEKVVTATPEPEPEGISREDTLIIGASNDPLSLEPKFSSGLTGPMVFSAVFDRLGWRSEPDMAPELNLAESIEQIEPTVWQVKLRAGVKFHNGNPLTADAVKVTIERYLLEGANRWYYNQAGMDHVEVVDELTANIHTKEPFMLMFEALSVGFGIQEPEWYSINYHDDGSVTSVNPLEEIAVMPIGTGPYKFVEYVRDDHITLARNDEYWGEKPAFKQVIIRIIPEAIVRLAELEAGNVDIVESIPLDKVDAIEEMPGIHVAFKKGRGRVYARFNPVKGDPAVDKTVVKALQYAVDVDTIIETLLGGGTERMATFQNPPHGDSNLKAYPYDPDKAKELLAEAGYPDGFKTNIWYDTARLTNPGEVVQAIAAYLGEVGVEAEVKPLEHSVFWPMYLNCEMDGLVYCSKGGEYTDQGGLQYLSINHSLTSACTQWDNPEWNELYAELRKEMDWTKRKELNLKLQGIAHEDPPILMLYYEPGLYGVSDSVNFEPRLDGRIQPHRVTKAK